MSTYFQYLVWTMLCYLDPSYANFAHVFQMIMLIAREVQVASLRGVQVGRTKIILVVNYINCILFVT